MARRALKGINWAAIAERLEESERVMFSAFKSKSDQYMQRMMEFPETPAPIDWAFYKKNVPVAGMVDKFQKEFESLKVPYPADNYTSLIEAEESKVMAEVQEFLDQSNKRVAEYQAELDYVKSLLPFDQMTMEDFAEQYPENAINLDKPTIWPHDPEEQPGDEPFPVPKPEH